MKKGLGRGIGALFAEDTTVISDASAEKSPVTLKLTDIEPNKNQPRKDFDKEKIASLAESIKEYGLIQPIVVTKNSHGRYVIVAGERRWRAAKAAKLKEVPVIINDYTKEQIAEIALIENLQREDLNPIEEALGYQSLMEDYGLTQEEVSAKLGKSRSAVANSIRLLSLDDEIKKYLISGELSSGHARAVLTLPEKEQRVELAQRIILNGLNVRQAEAAAKAMQKTEASSKKSGPTAYDIEIEALCERLSAKFGTKVSLKSGKNKNKIEIEYYSGEDLERILELFNMAQ